MLVEVCHFPITTSWEIRRHQKLLRGSYKLLNQNYIFTHQSDQEQLKSLNTMAYTLKRYNSNQTARVNHVSLFRRKQ